MSKSRDAFRTISEVSDTLDTPAHVLRFWESKFTQVKPVKRAGGRRYYRPADVDLLAGIKQLLHEDGMTIKGAQKLLREQGIKHVLAIGAEQLGAKVTAKPDETVVGATFVEPVPEVGVVAEEQPLPDPEQDITTIAPVSVTPPPNPMASLDGSTKVMPTSIAPTVNDAWRDIATDPKDADSKASARLFHLLHKAPRDKLATRAAAIAPHLKRIQLLRDRIEAR